MSDLTEWLLACIAEDEMWANSCEGLHWHWVGDETDRPTAPDPMPDVYLRGPGIELVSLRSVEEFPHYSLPGTGPRFLLSGADVTEAAAGHIARQDPAHVLAVCKAHRAIVELHRGCHVCPSGHGVGYTDHSDGSDMGEGVDVCPTLRALATIYADRPGWREEWAS